VRSLGKWYRSGRAAAAAAIPDVIHMIEVQHAVNEARALHRAEMGQFKSRALAISSSRVHGIAE